MLSARSVAEFCRKEAALLAAISRLLASCRCLSGRSRDFSLVIGNFPFGGFFGTGGGTFLSSCNRVLKLRVNCVRKVLSAEHANRRHEMQNTGYVHQACSICALQSADYWITWIAIHARDTDKPLLFQQPLQILQSYALKKTTLPSTVLAGILNMQSAYLTFIRICLILADTLLHSL